MNQIIRDRHLTPEEAAKYDLIRRQVEQDLPELITLHHCRMEAPMIKLSPNAERLLDIVRRCIAQGEPLDKLVAQIKVADLKNKAQRASVADLYDLLVVLAAQLYPKPAPPPQKVAGYSDLREGMMLFARGSTVPGAEVLGLTLNGVKLRLLHPGPGQDDQPLVSREHGVAAWFWCTGPAEVPK
jgi:hypothetical protein